MRKLSTYRWQAIIRASLIYIVLAALLTFLSAGSGGIISMGFIIYLFEWCALAVVGILLLILKWAGIVPIKNTFFHAFICVSNLFNGLGGMVYLSMQKNASSLMSDFFLLAATACVGLLYLVEIVTGPPGNDGRGHQATK